MKPQRAEDADLSKLPYPMIFMPKIDGVRGINFTGIFTGRSLDPFEGYGVTEMFSQPEYVGLDGEVTLGPDPRAENLCSNTTGALGRFKGVTEVADYHWWLFDFVEGMKDACYEDRLDALASHYETVIKPRGLHDRLHLVEFEIVENMEQARRSVDHALNMNYEGGIFRNPRAKIKEGKPSTKTQEYMRVKPWLFSDIKITGIREGAKNTNEKKTNSLGNSERSSAKAGMVPNGEVGAVLGMFLKDVIHPFNGRCLFQAGVEYEFGPGRLTTPMAKHYFENQHEFVGQYAEVKHLAHGTKDKPRMGTFERLRLPQDIVD